MGSSDRHQFNHHAILAMTTHAAAGSRMATPIDEGKTASRRSGSILTLPDASSAAYSIDRVTSLASTQPADFTNACTISGGATASASPA